MKLSNFSPTHQLVLTALMAGINVIFALLSSFFFPASLFIMLFLPLASIIVALNVDLRFYPVYVIATLVLSLLVNFAHFDTTLFFLLPILLSGLTFGLLIKKNLPDIILLLVVSLVNLAVLFLTIPLINLIYEIDFMTTFSALIGFSNIDFGRFILPAILALLAFMQTLITLLIISQDAPLFRIKINTDYCVYTRYINLGLIVAIIPLMFFKAEVALVLLLYILFISIYLFIPQFSENLKFAVVLLAVVLLFAASGIALFNQYTTILSLLGIIIGVIPIVISDFLWLYISRRKIRSVK